MVKTITSNTIERFLEFFKSQSFRKVESRAKKRTLKGSSRERILSGYVSNDIFISRSGQVKIDNLDSCQKLVSTDFVVF